MKQFGFEPRYYFNDISFDKANVQGLFYYLEKIRFEDAAKYENLLQFVFGHEDEKDEILIALKAHLSYLEGDFKSSADYFSRMIERCPTNIDTWIYLSFALMKTKHYGLAWDILFNLYHFIHFYQKYNFHTLNPANLEILKNIIKNSEPKNDYLWQPKFEEEFLIISRGCNNNCITCPNESSLRSYDVMQYLDGIGWALRNTYLLKSGKNT